MNPVLGGSMKKPLQNVNKLFDKDISLTAFRDHEEREEEKKVKRETAK